MCGIAGYFAAGPDPYPPIVLERMNLLLRHRGPDGEGCFRTPTGGFSHRRLSIVDIAAGAQPMTNEDGSLRITYNGEVFNHASIRGELERSGHTYRTRSDTETILHAYEEWGPDSLQRFRGMFAYAIWDGPRQTLFAARDRLGIKPFYYFWNGSVFVFASEIKALLAHPAVPAAIETAALPEYFAFGHLSQEQTMFRGVRQLMPGHWLRLALEGEVPRLAIERYWDIPEPDPAAAAAYTSDAGWITSCRQRLEETVRMRLMSDVPLGMFLSGGVDSSAVTALAQREVAGRVKTFAVGYAEEECSELRFAQQAAAHIGTEHREIRIGEADFFGALATLIWHEDKPVVWPSSVALHFVSKLAARHVKVVLTGEGADELFGGYARYAAYRRNRAWMRRYSLVPAAVRAHLRRQLESAPMPPSLRRKLQHTPLGREDSVTSLHFDNYYCALSASEQTGLFPGLSQAPSPYEACLRYWDAAAVRTSLGQMLYVDQKTYLVELLMKQDRMSMSCSIESRVPLLDHTLVEFAASVPDSLKIRGGTGKYIFKKAVEDLLPHTIVHRPKMGFPTPLARWLRGPGAETVFAELRKPKGMLRQIADAAALDALIERHRSGRIDATDRLWRLLTFQLWADLFFLGPRHPAEHPFHANSLGQPELSASHH